MTDEQQQPKRSNGAFIAIIIILILGLGFMAYLWSTKNSELNQCMNENAELNSDMNGMNEMLSGYVGNMSNDLKTDFKNMLETYDALLEKDKSQADSINAQKAKIQELLDQMEKNKNLSARQIFLLKKENETLRNIMKGYVVQIDSLNTLNLRLTSDLDSTTNALTNTQNDLNQAQADIEEKDKVLSEAAKLNAYGFSSGALKKKLGGSMGPTNKARNSAQMKSSFTIGKNSVAPKGRKPVYMQIIAPDGKTLQNRNYVLETTSGQKVPYTDKKEIDYNGQSIDVTVYFDLNGVKPAKGNYKVRIYCQGSLVGSDSFTLK